ncbi:MAG: hypothetical protein ABIC95_02010 [archaeon]
MTDKQFEEGPCTECKRSTSIYCDSCNCWVCEDHVKRIRKAHDETMEFCSHCIANLKVGEVVGDVKITKEMLDG